MPVFMNMFAVVDGSGNKPKYGERTMTEIYATANRHLAAAAGFVMPWAYQPYTLNYTFSFGNPVQGPSKAGDSRCAALTSMLRQETSGWLSQFYERTSLFVNVFFMWDISSGYEDVVVRGVTLNSQTVLIDTNESAIGGLALAHEIGHALMGPGHVEEKGNLMYFDLTYAGSFDERENKVRQARHVELPQLPFALLELVRGRERHRRLFAQRLSCNDQTTAAERRQDSKGCDSG